MNTADDLTLHNNQYTWRILVEQQLATLPEHLGLLPVFSLVRVARSLVFCVVFCRSLFVLLSFLFRSLYCLSFFFSEFWSPLWYLQTLLIHCNFIIGICHDVKHDNWFKNTCFILINRSGIYRFITYRTCSLESDDAKCWKTCAVWKAIGRIGSRSENGECSCEGKEAIFHGGIFFYL